METKKEVIRKLDKKIDERLDMIRENISYLNESLNNIDSSINIVTYLSYLKDDLIKNNGA